MKYLNEESIAYYLNSDDWLKPEAAAIAIQHLKGKKCALLSSAAKNPSGGSWVHMNLLRKHIRNYAAN